MVRELADYLRRASDFITGPCRPPGVAITPIVAAMAVL